MMGLGPQMQSKADEFPGFTEMSEQLPAVPVAQQPELDADNAAAQVRQLGITPPLPQPEPDEIILNRLFVEVQATILPIPAELHSTPAAPPKKITPPPRKSPRLATASNTVHVA